MPQLNIADFAPQIIWALLCFTVLYVALSRFVLPAIGGTLETRAQRIEGDLARARLLRAEMETATSAYEAALADARARAKATVQTAREAVDAEIKQQSEASERQIAADAAQAEARIAAMRATALAEVDGIAVDTAVAIVDRLAGITADRASIEAALVREPDQRGAGG